MTYFGYFVPVFGQTGKKIVHYFVNTQRISCSKVEIPRLCKQQMNIEVFYVIHCSFLHTLEQRHSVFARDCVEKYSVTVNIS